jgi:membrane-associated phospholipid phosphatase
MSLSKRLPRGAPWRLALAVTSAAVNGPMKLLAGRQRPAPRRRLRHMPGTSSFPSGHSASAFAFAVAATRELPEAGPMLLPLAAGVAYSRVYLGVHYPSDVLAGGAFGTAVGMATRRRGEPPHRPGRGDAILRRGASRRSRIAISLR